uniref:Uncharacterized protein n=1 Tax=Anopheles stephensi TaxID=30069 RepID=A0A182XXM3_ANOST
MGEYDKSTMTDCAQVDGQSVCAPPVQILRIESLIVHTGFNKPRYANDIALIRLRDRADTSRSNVKPICLPVTNELRSSKPTRYTLTAWASGSRGNVLERSQRELVESVECQKLYTDKSVTLEKTTRQICIKQQQESGSRCNFPSSAAPLQVVQQVQGKSRYVLYGVLSYGPKNCSALYPDVYTNVASYMDWILENIQDPSYLNSVNCQERYNAIHYPLRK